MKISHANKPRLGSRIQANNKKASDKQQDPKEIPDGTVEEAALFLGAAAGLANLVPVGGTIVNALHGGLNLVNGDILPGLAGVAGVAISVGQLAFLDNYSYPLLSIGVMGAGAFLSGYSAYQYAQNAGVRFPGGLG